MRKLTWIEYCDEHQENQRHLRNLIKRIYKTPGNSVSDNTVHMVEKELKENNTFTLGDIAINVQIEKIEVLYNCDDIEEVEDMKKDSDVKKVNGLDIILSCDIKSYKVVLNNMLGDVLTSNEAAKLYKITEGSIRSAIKTGKLRFGIDYRKAGRITLITRKAMEREYKKNLN